MVRTDDGTGLARLLGRDIEQPLGVGGVGQVFAAAGPTAPTPRLEPLAHPPWVEPQAREQRLAGAAGLHQRQQDMLRPDRIVPESLGLGSGIVERALDGRAQRIGIEARRGLGSQSGLASSMSMMGMPSSTG